MSAISVAVRCIKTSSRWPANWDEGHWQRFESGKKDTWQYIEFGCRRGNWKQFRRAIFCRLMHDDCKQLYLPGFRPDTIIVTNIGQGQPIDGMLKTAGCRRIFDSQWSYRLLS